MAASTIPGSIRTHGTPTSSSTPAMLSANAAQCRHRPERSTTPVDLATAMEPGTEVNSRVRVDARSAGVRRRRACGDLVARAAQHLLVPPDEAAV